MRGYDGCIHVGYCCCIFLVFKLLCKKILVTLMSDDSINQEVRLRFLERLCETIHKKLDDMDSKLDSQFKWTIGIILSMFSAFVIPMVLHYFRLD